MAAPKKPIDLDKVKEYAEIACTLKEIASFLGVNERTLFRSPEVMAVYHASLDEFNRSLRRLQWATAQGNDTEFLRDAKGEIVRGEKNRAVILKPGSAPNEKMQEFLGKNYLGQADKTDITSGGEKLKPWTKTQLQIPAAPNTVPTQELDPATPEKN